LNALFPIPLRVLRKGFAEGGQEWMWANWGVLWPIRRVKFAVEENRTELLYEGTLLPILSGGSFDCTPFGKTGALAV